ncbi:hypothetical protein [Prevotella sp.]|uniref:hypothetical protein n=1 Tax=Prevotella sp. TaxID=59823 RepID=UPI002F951B9C
MVGLLKDDFTGGKSVGRRADKGKGRIEDVARGGMGGHEVKGDRHPMAEKK